MNFQEITQFERKLFNHGIRYVAGIDEVGRGPLAGPFVVSAVILDLEKIFSEEFRKILDILEKTVEDKSDTTPSMVENAVIGIKKGKLGKKEIGEKNLKINDVLKDQDGNLNFKLYNQINDSKKISAKKRVLLSEFIKREAISYSIEVFEAEELDRIGISELTQRAFFKSIVDLKVKPQYVLTDTFEVAKITKNHQKNIISGDSKSISIASASIVAKVFRDNIMVEMHQKYPVYGFDRHKGYGTKMHIEALQKHGPCEIHRRSFEPLKSWFKDK